MRGVLLRTDPKPPAPPPWRGAMLLAERALTRRGLRGEQHALLRYVIARYLMNGLSDRAILDASHVVGFFNHINRLADGLGVDLEPDMPPDPRASQHPI